MSRSICILVIALLAPPALAQGRVWHLGPGGNINATIAQASDGDVIRLAPGIYGGFTLDKGLTMLGSGAQIQGGLQGGQCAIVNLPAGSQATVQGILFGFYIFNVQVTVSRNRGRVLLDRISVKNSDRSPGIRIEDSAQVHLQNAFAVGAPALQATRSTVVLTDCRLVSSGMPFGSLPGIPAVLAADSTVLLSRGTVAGPQNNAFAPGVGTEAILATDSTLTILGDASTLITAGFLGPNEPPIPAIVADRGSVTLDPNVTVVAGGGAPPVSGSASVVRMRLPSLSVASGPPGGRLGIDLFSQSGDGVIVMFGAAADRLALGMLGFWLDPARFVVAGAGVQGPGEHFTMNLPLPPDPSLAHTAWAVQAISGTPAGGFRLSNPVVFALE
jgi:hypothetical protein